ncbi:MAG: GNAT family N-acetyltransferase [Candidatus Hydrogenedens sp.]
MPFTPIKELPANFNLFLRKIIHNESYRFGKYIHEFLPFLNPLTYTRLIELPYIECLQDSYSGKNPSTFIIASCNNPNTRREVLLLEHLENDNRDNFELFINGLFQYWRDHQIQEIIFDIPVPMYYFLDQILCPLSFQSIPRLIMIRELSKSDITEIQDKNISIISVGEIPSAFQCLSSAYQNTTWKYLHPEVNYTYDGFKFLENLINIHKDTGCPAVLQYKLNNQTIGILLGNYTGLQSACLIHLAVHPSYRRQGIATLLLRTWCFLIYQQGIKNIFLWTHLTNPALKLYRKEHFRSLHAYPAFYYNSQKDSL